MEGYKLHLTETCDPEEPRLITQVTTTVATVPDGPVTETIQDDLIRRSLTPETHWVDAGYVSTDNLYQSHHKGINLMGQPEPIQAGKHAKVAMTRTNSPLIGSGWWRLVLKDRKVCTGRKASRDGEKRKSTFSSVVQPVSSVQYANSVLGARRMAVT